jgi:hypothetical protein
LEVEVVVQPQVLEVVELVVLWMELVRLPLELYIQPLLVVAEVKDLVLH